MVKNCGYNEPERMVRDRIVMGTNNNHMRKKLLEIENLNLQKTIEVARASELVDKRIKDMETKELHNIDVLNINERKTVNKKHTVLDSTQKQQSIRNIHCKFCKTFHEYRKCPAFGKRCNNCFRFNHFSIACKSSKVREIQENENIISENEVNIDMVNLLTENNRRVRWYEKVRVDDTLINFKLDTGSDVNTLPYRFLKYMKNVQIDKTSSPLIGYGGQNVSQIGSANFIVMCRNEISVQKFSIVNTDSEPLLGLKACMDLNLVKRVDLIEDDVKREFIEQNIDVFQGIGCFINNVDIKIKPNAIPVVKPARRIPLSLVEKVKKELQLMVENKIIEKVDGPVERASHLVIVEKKSKQLRLCIDPQNLNDDILLEHHVIPTFESIAANLAHKQIFSVLDLKEGFWQIGLSNDASNLCTFNTPFGCYRFNRLPYGIKVGPEVFQKYNERNFEDISGVTVFIDDVLIAADSIEEHDRILMQVINRARERNIKFNQAKFQYRISEVKYLGKIISKSGIKCDPDRVEAIRCMEAPKNKKDLQKLLGMVNYVREYIPDLADICQPMRELLKNNVVFNWQEPHERCLNVIKEMIMNAPTLQIFDPVEHITIETDASKFGLGCCLMQKGKPITFASRSLSDAEINYAQVEKELLAVVFACRKFHYYIYGRNITVRSDHKPLIEIMKKDFCKIPSARLQRLKLSLIKYTMNLIHVPGKYLYVADFLSRYYNKTDQSCEIEDLNEFVHSINITDERLIEFRKELRNDKCLFELKQLLMEGWPDDRRQLSEEVKFYWKHRNDLYLEDDIIFLNDRVIVPVNLREYVLSKIHMSHLGIEKTKKRARSIVYWPGIDESIERIVSRCEICQKYRSANIKEPMISHSVPELPYQKLGIDICQYAAKSYLVISDFYSRYLDIIPLQNKTAAECIAKLKICFSNHGIPLEIVSDNMPFDSYEFKKFCDQCDIKITTTSPIYSQANGFSEKAVGIAKNLIKKCLENGTELWLALLEYRNTPLKEVEASPVELLMSRKTRTLVPGKKSLFVPSIVPTILENIKNKNVKSGRYYNRNAIFKSSFKKNEDIWYHDSRNGWIKGIIAEAHDAPRSYWIRLIDGTVIRRNSKWIRKRK